MPNENIVLAATRDIRISSFGNDTSTHIFDGTAATSDWSEVRDDTAVYTDAGLTITTQVSSGYPTAGMALVHLKGLVSVMRLEMD